MDTCLKNTLVLNKNSKVFLSPKQHPDIVVGNGGGLNNDPTKQDNIIAVGGPRKILDRI